MSVHEDKKSIEEQIYKIVQQNKCEIVKIIDESIKKLPTNPPTHPPTEAPTNAPTEPPTEAPTNAPTNPPIIDKKTENIIPVVTEKTSTNTAKIAGGVIGAVAGLGVAAALTRLGVQYLGNRPTPDVVVAEQEAMPTDQNANRESIIEIDANAFA